MREGILGEIQVGEVSAAASQQGPKKLAEKQRTERNELCCVQDSRMGVCCVTVILAPERCTND